MSEQFPSLYYSQSKLFGDKIAMKFGDETLSYSTLDSKSSSIACVLYYEFQVKKEQSVAILSKNCLIHPLVLAACGKIGVVYTPINHNLGHIVMETLISLAEPVVVFVHPNLKPEVDKIKNKFPNIHFILFDTEECSNGYLSLQKLIEEVNKKALSLPDIQIDGNDTAIRLSTSGTTGFPKAVDITFNNLNYQLKIELNFSPCIGNLIHQSGMFHASQFFTLLFFKKGGTVILLEHFDLEEFLAACKKNEITHTFLIPTFLKQIVNYAKQSDENHQIVLGSLKSFKRIFSGGMIMEPSVLREAYKLFPHIEFYVGYGMTELVAAITSLTHEDITKGIDNQPELLTSCGRVLPEDYIRIVDDQGQEVPTGTQGKIQIKSKSISKGYYKNPQAWINSIDNGYLKVGDIGKVDKEGYLYILGREKEQIQPGAILPNLVNNVLDSCTGVLDSICLGIPYSFYDHTAPDLYSYLEAFVVVKSGVEVTEDSLKKELLKKGVTNICLPVKIHFVQTIVKNSVGKPDTNRIREIYKKQLLETYK